MAAHPPDGESTPGGEPGAPPARRAAARSPAAGFFGVVARPQTWLNLLYLGLSFPLGLFYFVFLTVCLSVGISLVIIWVGLFILGLTAACWWAFAAFERSLADGLLGTRLVPSPQPWRRAAGHLAPHQGPFHLERDLEGPRFSVRQVPAGPAVVRRRGQPGRHLAGAPGGAVLLPVRRLDGAHGVVHHGLDLGVWTVDKLWQALLLVPLGLLLAVVSFHAFNGLAAMWRRWPAVCCRPTPRHGPRRSGRRGLRRRRARAPPRPPAGRPTSPRSAGRLARDLGLPGPARRDPRLRRSVGGGRAPGGQPPYGWVYYPPAPYPQQPVLAAGAPTRAATGARPTGRAVGERPVERRAVGAVAAHVRTASGGLAGRPAGA